MSDEKRQDKINVPFLTWQQRKDFTMDEHRAHGDAVQAKWEVLAPEFWEENHILTERSHEEHPTGVDIFTLGEFTGILERYHADMEIAMPAGILDFLEDLDARFGIAPEEEDNHAAARNSRHEMFVDWVDCMTLAKPLNLNKYKRLAIEERIKRLDHEADDLRRELERLDGRDAKNA